MVVVTSLRNKSTICFLLVLSVLTLLLYCNTFSSGYVWDDRAAIVGNKDVHGKTPLSSIFWHDFWGQDITDHESHKSYRPVTTLSYRLNYYLAELSPFWFHVGNVLIYIMTVCAFYLACLRWISVEGSRVAALLFLSHPIHCEAVSSLVGRADCLSGLFYILSLMFYSDGLGRLRVISSVTFNNAGVIWSNFLMAYFFALAASLSKEIGITIFGLFCIFEAIYASSLSHKLPKHYLMDMIALENDESILTDKCNDDVTLKTEQICWVHLSNQWATRNRMPLWCYICDEIFIIKANLTSSYLWSLLLLIPSIGINTLNYLQLMWSPDDNGLNPSIIVTPRQKHPLRKPLRQTILWFLKFPVGIYGRIFVHIMTLGAILYVRSLLHGDTQLYSWTIMENPISLEPAFLTRVLSYAHTHYLMMLKLFNPLTPHSCFDYGHYCLPTIGNVMTVINLLAAVVYALIFYWIMDIFLLGRRASLLIFSLFLLPLFPALNILFPVGTTLAERLLFVPSMGICMMIGEYFVHRLSFIWEPIGAHWMKMADEMKCFNIAASTRKETTISNAKGKSMPRVVMFTVLLPVFVTMSYRVHCRNTEWKDEYSIYMSALKVCPKNYKALTNTGMLLLNKNKTANAALAATLSDRYTSHLFACPRNRH